MVDHPVEEVVVEIVCTSNFIWAPDLRQLQLITFVEQMKDCHHLLIFERVLSLRRLTLWIITRFTLFLLLRKLAEHVHI